VPSPAALATFCANEEANYLGVKGAPGDPALQSVCQLAQLTPAANPSDFDASGSCAGSADKGWCYVQASGSSLCSQAIVFAPAALPIGSLTTLVCQ
jgi:hypothetical protein